MPELPEVETTRRGIAQHISGQPIMAVDIQQTQLRWPIPTSLAQQLPGQTVNDVGRRGKYLVLNCTTGSVIIHLGMSGCLRIQSAAAPLQKHDHFILHFVNGDKLCFNDPRRFGCVLWTETDPLQHPLLAKLGPEPLTNAFNAHYLYEKSRKRTASIKQFIMDSAIVVGVGNIYACEALFAAGIHPQRAAGNITLPRYQLLTSAIKKILRQAIKRGGTTLRDFYAIDGKPGYFRQQLNVYGRSNEACVNCNHPIKSIRLAQRSSHYCPNCQT